MSEEENAFKEVKDQEKFDELAQGISELFAATFIGHSMLLVVAANEGDRTSATVVVAGKGQMNQAMAMKAIADGLETAMTLMMEEYRDGKIRHIAKQGNGGQNPPSHPGNGHLN